MSGWGPLRRGPNDTEKRKELARELLAKSEAGQSAMDLATQHGLTHGKVRTLLWEARKESGTEYVRKARKPQPPRPPRQWHTKIELKLVGTPAGDAMVLAQLADNRTMSEPTHELHGLLGDNWETLAVGDHASMQGDEAWQTNRIERGISAYSAVRVVSRVAP